MVATTGGPYFGLTEHCVFVPGATRAALYDLDTGDLYSVDPVGRQVIEAAEARHPVPALVSKVAADHPAARPEQVHAYLMQLEEAGLGAFLEMAVPRAKPALPRPPGRLQLIWLELREDCNLRCRHCYCTCDSRPRTTRRLDYDEWIDVMRAARDCGCRSLQLIGGEPFLFGDRLFDLARQARRLGFSAIEVFSNLTFLKQRWVDQLVELGINVACSLYSRRPEIHDLVTTVPGSFKKTLGSIRRLQERGVQPRFAVTVMKHNQDYVEETMAFLEELGDPRPGFDLVRPSGRGNDAELEPDRYARKRNYQTNPVFRQTSRSEFLVRYWGNSCWFGKAAVASNGDVHPCIMQREAPAGNVRKQRLGEILSNGIRKYWDLSYDKIETCRDCEYRYACRDCRPITFGPTGELTAKSVYCSYDPYAGEWRDLA